MTDENFSLSVKEGKADALPREGVFLGVDTSNYTTSVGILSEDGEVLANIKRPLPVKPGECGLRQSDAVFAHVKNLPSAMEEAKGLLASKRILAVGVSTRPRAREGSYMPCFLVGQAVAQSISAATGAPLFSFSHQCGHMMAAIVSSGRWDLLTGNFYAFHISGGTTDLLSVHMEGDGFFAKEIGGTDDLHAGQAIDRIGVMMGLPFPAGVHLEALAKENRKQLPKKHPKVRGTYASLSGLENLAEKLWHETEDKSLTAAFTLSYLCDAIEGVTKNAIAEGGTAPVLFVGGVMSNSILKARLATAFDAAFAVPALSADNAVGIAALAAHRFGARFS
ncbi:MAG TPA: hypothetical protein DDY70_03920 [Clostridiales bacterium]|nr:hypothetical protein [Clostridiales bacterium]